MCIGQTYTQRTQLINHQDTRTPGHQNIQHSGVTVLKSLGDLVCGSLVPDLLARNGLVSGCLVSVLLSLSSARAVSYQDYGVRLMPRVGATEVIDI